ncbi:MAG TPA: HDOD domain-containing protein [Campylobacterales bacterium]|nr:HDOD domain-containing protein [Campylobacterales bacterium]
MTTESILEKVKAFPPLDDTVTKVMAVCNDVNGSIGDLAKVVQNDPMTTANILKAANSPLYGFSREIKGITQAVSIFGMDTVKGFAFSSFLQKKPDLNLEPYGIDTRDFASISEQQNAFVAKWLKGKKEMLDILSLTSFLMEVGKIVLASVVVEHGKIDEYKEHMNAVETVSEISTIEAKVFGITNEEVTSILLEEWNFDSEMFNAIRHLHNPENADKSVQKYAQALHVTKTLISTHNFGKEPQVEAALELVEKYGLDKDRFEEVVADQFNIASV